jgi:hypothetical protein
MLDIFNVIELKPNLKYPSGELKSLHLENKKTGTKTNTIYNENKENIDISQLSTPDAKSMEVIVNQDGKTVIYYDDDPMAREGDIEKILIYRGNRLYKTLYKNSYKLSKNKKYILGELITKDGGAKKDVYKINGDFVFTRTFDSGIVENWRRCMPESRNGAEEMEVSDSGDCLIHKEYSNKQCEGKIENRYYCQKMKK